MRIELLEDLPVILAETPLSHWGRVKIVYSPVEPVINPETQTFEMPESVMSHAFPKGTVLELPQDEMDSLISEGKAKLYVSPTGERVRHIHTGIAEIDLPTEGGE